MTIVMFNGRIKSASILAVIMAGLLTVSPAISLAAVADGTLIPPKMLKPLARWVEKTSGLRLRNLPLALASNDMLKNSLGLEGVQKARSLGAYLPGRIIISNALWDPQSLSAQSYVVHELVHHAQLLSRKKYACDEQKEEQAYRLQNMWLVQHGESPLYDDGFIAQLSICPTE